MHSISIFRFLAFPPFFPPPECPVDRLLIQKKGFWKNEWNKNWLSYIVLCFHSWRSIRLFRKIFVSFVLSDVLSVKYISKRIFPWNIFYMKSECITCNFISHRVHNCDFVPLNPNQQTYQPINQPIEFIILIFLLPL